MVSIIIPTYNRSQLVKEGIDSLLAQTYNDLEIHVVDDGSTDDTQQIIIYIAQKDNRVEHYLRPHSSFGYMTPAVFAAMCIGPDSAALYRPQCREDVSESLSQQLVLRKGSDQSVQRKYQINAGLI